VKTVMVAMGHAGTDQGQAGKSARVYGTMCGKASYWSRGPETSVGKILMRERTKVNSDKSKNIPAAKMNP
jgi:hypothetical protein